MINYQTTCNPQRIQLFLERKLSDEELSALESHLSDCDDCRRQLETAVASEDLWSEVRESLRNQAPPTDRPQVGDSDSTGEDASSSQATVLKLLAPTDDDRMIGRWGTYEVLGVVGSGGMGVVLKAFDAALNRYVAIKILAPHLGSSGAAIRRFSREGKAAAAVVHDNVIEISFVTDGKHLAERSAYHFVKDARADVVQSLGEPLKVYGAGKCGYGTLNLNDFAMELGWRNTLMFRLIHGPNGVSALRSDDSRTVIEVDDNTGIIRHFHRKLDNQASSEVYQLGVLRCTGDVLLPAVVVRTEFLAGTLTYAEVLSPISVTVNNPLPDDTFKVAEHKGASILDFRHRRDAHWVTIGEDVSDVVDYLARTDATRANEATKTDRGLAQEKARSDGSTKTAPQSNDDRQDASRR